MTRVIEDENKILSALRGGRVHAVRIKDGVVTEIHLHNGTKLTGAMVVSSTDNKENTQ